MKIKFIPGSEKIKKSVFHPKPGKQIIPDWYKNISIKSEVPTVKQCVPFLDALNTGYIQETWTDIYISNINNKVSASFDHEVPILLHRDKFNMPIENNFYQKEFVWLRPWSAVFPEGFCGLVTHPLNRIDLPFTTMSGIVDFDKSIHAPIGRIPFYIRNGFTGIIPTGTPMFQIIPIKREFWESEVQSYDVDFWKTKEKERYGIKDFYKKNIWQRKRFD